ncbi:MAG TPA: sulfurtransferase TusA family protein [Nitrolancea sp.]|nr:sulfurtransferase TusA family protein [Nitrolancea sp.]
MEQVAIDKEVDARGSFCPGPLMELMRTVKTAPVGSTIAVLSSDPGSNKDIPVWVAKARYELVGVFEEAGYTRFVIRKAH